jgi:hypothetical protein
MLPPDSDRAAVSGPPPRTSKARHLALRMGAGARGAPSQPNRAKGRAAQPLGHGVFPHRQITHHAHGMAVFRDAGHAAA